MIIVDFKYTIISKLFKLFALPQSNAELWKMFSIEKEFKRMKFDEKMFHISDVNSNYEVCETYPKKLIMLKGLTNEQIVNDSDLRNNHRFPIFTWHSDDVFIFQTASIHNSYSIDNEQNLVYIYREMIPSALTFHTIVFGSDIPKLTQIASMKYF